MEMKALLVVICGLLFVSCASTQFDSVAALPGFYESVHGGFNESLYLELRSDDTYSLQHVFIGDVIAADGTFNSSGGEDTGTWSLEDGIVALKATKIGTDRSPMFLPAYCGRFKVGSEGGKVSLTSVLTPAIPAGSPEKIVLVRVASRPIWQEAAPKREAQPGATDNPTPPKED